MYKILLAFFFFVFSFCSFSYAVEETCGCGTFNTTWSPNYYEPRGWQQTCISGGSTYLNNAQWARGWKYFQETYYYKNDYCRRLTDGWAYSKGNPIILSKSELSSLIENGFMDASYLYSQDTDNDGFNDYSEIMQEVGDYLSASVYPSSNLPMPAIDSNNDGIYDSVAIALGYTTTETIPMTHYDLTSTTVANYNPTPLTQAVVMRLGSGTQNDPYTYIPFDTFTLPALEPFGSPATYTLGDYGNVPQGVDLKLVTVTYTDGVPIYDYTGGVSVAYSSSGSYGTNTDASTWTAQTVSGLTYTGGGSYSSTINANAVNNNSNSSTAGTAWSSATDPYSSWGGFVPSSSSSADTQIDPRDIAEGIILAGSAVQKSSELLVTSTEDLEISSAISDTSSALSALGDTTFEDSDSLSDQIVPTATGFLSWVDSLYQVPEIGKQSSITLAGFSYEGMTSEGFTINFDYEIVPLIRNLFLFFYYLMCVWIFFKLTRYGWG